MRAGLAFRPHAGGGRAPQPAPTGDGSATPQARRILLVYFSRAGENYFNGGRRVLEVGNTAVVAGLISARITCDVYRIEAADPYPGSYDATVARNTAEQRADGRPAIARPLPDVAPYDTVLLGSPIWNVRAPMIMSSFVDGVDLAGKRVLPFVTYAVSGLAGVDDGYRTALPKAEIGPALAVRGEDSAGAGTAVDAWLRDVGLLR